MTQELINLNTNLTQISQNFNSNLSTNNKEAMQIITYTVIAIALTGITVYQYIKNQENL